jgi:hypothetical protein
MRIGLRGQRCPDAGTAWGQGGADTGIEAHITVCNDCGAWGEQRDAMGAE